MRTTPAAAWRELVLAKDDFDWLDRRYPADPRLRTSWLAGLARLHIARGTYHRSRRGGAR